MADPNTRTGKRTPVTLKIKFKSETIEQFIERYAVDVSQGGIFIRTKEPLAVGTQMRFEFQLRDASPLIAGEGTVVWTRENDPSRPAIAPGMGVRFDRLAEGSPTVLERILSEKLKQVPARTGADTTKPPLFRDEPTRVAPAPVQDMLNQADSKPAQARTVSRNAMPFHSDADEFPEEAFEEQTKVRSLDELVAQTAQANQDTPDPARELFGSGPAMNTTIIPPDELAMRRQQARQDATLDDASAANSAPLLEPPPAAEAKNIPEPSRDSAPSLPNPPSAPAPMPLAPQPLAGAGREPRLLDTTPSPRAESGLVGNDPMGKTQLGVAAPTTKPGVSAPTENKPAPSVAAVAMLSPEAKPAAVAAKAETKATAAEPPAAAAKPSNRAISEPMRPLKKPSIMPIVVLVIAFVAAAAGAVWFFILKDTVDEDLVTKGKAQPIAPTPTPTQTPEQPAVTPGSNAVAAVGSNGSAAVAPTPPAPDVKLVDTVVAAPGADKATVTIDGTTFTGPAPLTAKLEPGKVYKAHVAAAGFVTLDLDVKGGAPASAKLVAKPKLLTVTSDPVGAQIIIEGMAVGHVTPFDVDIRPFGAKKSLHVTLRKAGFKPSDAVVDVSAPADDGAKLTVAAPAATLVVAPVPAYVPPPRPPVNKGSGDGTTPPTGDPPPVTPPPVTPPPATPETGSTPPPKPPGDGEPAPDFAK